MDRELEAYVQDVLARIVAPAAEKGRIEGDLRAHLEEAMARRQPDEPIAALLARMGSPADVAAEFMANVRPQLAEPGQRVTAGLVDWLLILGIGGSIIAIAARLLPQGGGSAVVSPDASLVTRMFVIPLCRLVILASIAGILAYFPFFEGRNGRTPGKELLNIRVLREDGTRIGYKEAFLRRLPLYLEFATLDALVMFFTPKRQRAFDIVAHTIVVQEGKPSGQ